MDGNRPHEPHLRKAHDSAENAKAERTDGGESGGQFGWLVVRRDVVAAEAPLEEEVVGEGNGLVDGEPVRDQQHEVLEHVLEVRVARDGDGAVDDRGEERPDEARDRRRPAAEHLQAESHAVDVRAVVRDDAERGDDEAELAEAVARGAAVRGEEHGGEHAADAAVVVAVAVGGVRC